jgi:hypothetical protein
VIVVIAATSVEEQDYLHESTIKLEAANPHNVGVTDSGRNFYRSGSDQ